jgi:hypothetical protein
MPSHLHWSDSRSRVRENFASREERKIERRFAAHTEACNCGDECYLARLESIVERQIALALSEPHYIVLDQMIEKE